MDIFRFSQAPSDMAAFEDTFRFAAFTIVRFAAFSANALVFGFLPILMLVVRPIFSSLRGDGWDSARARVASRIEGMTQAALLASGIVTAVAVVLQAVLVAEAEGGAFDATSFLAALETSFGRWYFLRFPLLGALAVLLVGRIASSSLAGAGDDRPTTRAWWWGAWGALSVLLLLTSTFSGHAAVASPRLVSFINDGVHLVAGAIWFTGIITLALVLPEAWRSAPSSDRLKVLAPSVFRFSHVAAASVAVLAITGTINSLLHVGSLNDLIDSGYGRTLAVKIVLFICVLALGGVNHYVVRDRLNRALEGGGSPESARVFRKTIAVELVLALTVMGVTGILVGLGRTRTEPFLENNGSVTSGSTP